MTTQPGHSTTDPSPSEQTPESFWQKRRLVGAIAGLLWLLVFSGGILIDAEDSRVALGWKREDVAAQAEVGRVAQKLGDQVEIAEVSAALIEVMKPTEAATAKKAQQKKVEGRWPIHNFICGMLFFTPINVAILAILAGFVGGCLSSKADLSWIKEDIREARQNHDQARLALLRRREHYLTEHPFHSTIRSFIIYLIFISGLYVFSSDPFNASSQTQGFTQYMRLAGLVSLLGFVVGYDPTKFQEWLALIPSPSRTPKRDDDGDSEGATELSKKETITRETTFTAKTPEQPPHSPESTPEPASPKLEFKSSPETKDAGVAKKRPNGK